MSPTLRRQPSPPSRSSRLAPRRRSPSDAAGCEQLQRDYLSFILTTLGGVGPPAFVEFLRDSFFHAGLAAVAAGTATASDANHAYHCFQESLQALVARGNSATVRRHTATDAAA